LRQKKKSLPTLNIKTFARQRALLLSALLSCGELV
jgi:hypothetical protein